MSDRYYIDEFGRLAYIGKGCDEFAGVYGDKAEVLLLNTVGTFYNCISGNQNKKMFYTWNFIHYKKK